MNCQTWTFHWTSYAIALPAIGLRSLWMMPAGQLEQPCGAQLAMLPAPLLETCCVWVTYMLKVIISYWWWCVTALQSMAVKRNLLLLSNSTLHGSGYLEYAADHIQQFLRGCGVTEVPRFTWGSQFFVNGWSKQSDANPVPLSHRCCLSHMPWGSRMSMPQPPGRLLRLGDSPSPRSTLLRTHILLPARLRWFAWLVQEGHHFRRFPQAIFIGGGNTFQLLDNLYKKNVLDIIRR